MEPMLNDEALRIMSALAQSTRFRIVDLLARTGEIGMASGEIADQVGVPRNLMSSHLAVLAKAGLVVSKKAGRAVVYVLRTSAILAVCRHLSTMVTIPNDADQE